MTAARAPRNLPGPTRRASDRAGGAFLLLCLLGPLEQREVGIGIGGMWVSPFELLAVLVAAVGAHACLLLARAPGGRAAIAAILKRPVFIGLVAWVGLMVVSAAWSAAPMASLKFGVRLGGGAALAMIVAVLGRMPRFAARVRTGLLTSLGVITALAILERSVGQAMEPVLAWFRDEPTWMLGEQRLSTVFYHANTFAVYLELTVPLLLLRAAAPDLRRGAAATRLLWLALGGAMLSLTYSRAGLLAGVLSAGLLAVAGRRAKLRRLARVAGAFAVLLVLAFGVNPDMRARLGLGVREYKVEYSVHGTCFAIQDEPTELVVTVHNLGSWPLSNRQAPGQLAWTLWDGVGKPSKRDFAFIDLPEIGAGRRVDVPVRIRMPARPGRYTALFDVRRKDVLWLSTVGSDLGRAPCVAGARGQPMLAADFDFGHRVSSIGQRRTELSRKHYWQAAARLLAERPLLGHGADRFRFEHGRLVPPGSWDSRARAHSVPVETAADLGILGLLALGLFAGGAAAVLLSNLLRAAAISPLQLAATVAVAAFALHSLVDYFLAYTKILAVFWPILGLACSTTTQAHPHPAAPDPAAPSPSRSMATPGSSPPA